MKVILASGLIMALSMTLVSARVIISEQILAEVMHILKEDGIIQEKEIKPITIGNEKTALAASRSSVASVSLRQPEADHLVVQEDSTVQKVSVSSELDEILAGIMNILKSLEELAVAQQCCNSPPFLTYCCSSMRVESLTSAASVPVSRNKELADILSTKKESKARDAAIAELIRVLGVEQQHG